MENFEIKDVEGFFNWQIVRNFHVLKHFKGNGTYKLIASISAGNFGSDGIKAQPNINGPKRVSEKLKKYLCQNEIEFIGLKPSFWVD